MSKRDRIKEKLSDGLKLIGKGKDLLDHLGHALERPDMYRGAVDAQYSSVDRESTERSLEKEWSLLYSVLLVTEKLLRGDAPINPKRYQSAEAEQFKNMVLEPVLAALVETSEAAAEQERLYQRATVILQGYYPNDKICDFIMDLLAAWDQDLTDGEPQAYAGELYNNSLHNIRRLFRRMQEKLAEMDLQTPGPSAKDLLERRLRALEQYRFSDPDIHELARTVRAARSAYNQVTAGLLQEEIPSGVKDPDRFIGAARYLCLLLLNEKKKITRERLESIAASITETVQREEMRIGQMQQDVDRAQRLYSALCDVLAAEDNIRLMNRLDPKAGELDNRTAGEIRELYRPLIEQVEGITREFER